MKVLGLCAWTAFLSAPALLVAACSSAGGTDSTASGGSSARGGSAGVGAINPGFGGSAAVGSGTCTQDSCARSVHEGEEVPLDMYIMFDRSGSMSEPTATGGTVWDATKNAFIDFVNAPESTGVGVGLQFFPTGGALPCAPFQPPPCPQGCSLFGPFCVPDIGGSCDPNDYLPPAVIIQPLPGVAPQIVNVLNGASPGGGTPTLPAMQSALQATRAYAQQVPGHKVIIVLATDGEPNDCNSTVPAVAQVAADGFNNAPQIPTFVIGIGNIAGLNQIAQAGGTGQALIVDPATAGQDFLDAMSEIRGRALSCDFNIPQPPQGEELNPDLVNVQLTPPDGACEVVYKVADETACDATLGGWYYNPARTLLKTCPATCDRLKTEKGRVEVQLGCLSIPIPQ